MGSQTDGRPGDGGVRPQGQDQRGPGQQGRCRSRHRQAIRCQPDASPYIFQIGQVVPIRIGEVRRGLTDIFCQRMVQKPARRGSACPKTPFDDLVQMCVDYLREYPMLCAAGVLIPLILLLAFSFLMSGEDEYKKSKSKKKSKKKEAKKD